MFLDQEWYPHQLAGMVQTLLEARRWQVASDGLALENKKSGMVLLPIHASYLVHEWPLWQRHYAPIPLRGKTVLDIGAGCGETAYFYFGLGARRVVCIEPNIDAAKWLTRNAAKRSWNVEIVQEQFRQAMLREFDFDFMKMDGEGCERELLQLSELPTPAVIESHSVQLTHDLARQFGAKVVARLSPQVSLLQVIPN